MPSLPLKWHGGKHYLAKRIIALMPPHLHYVEPYFGGGAVLFARDPNRDWILAADEEPATTLAHELRGCSEIVNDIDGELMNFWAVLREPKWRQLYERLQFTEMSEWVWDEADSNVPRDSLMRAWAFFIRYRQSRQGLGQCFATLSRTRTRRGMNEQVSAWLSAVEGLPEAHERLKRVVILNGDALDVIRQQDGPRTHFYCDPPYLHETRTAKDCYEHEMTEKHHIRLLHTLDDIAGTFQLSGYRSRLYDNFAADQGWRCVEFDLPNNASGAKRKERKTECVWMNY